MVGAMATAITKSLGTCKARRAPLAPEAVAGPMATSHGGLATVDALVPTGFSTPWSDLSLPLLLPLSVSMMRTHALCNKLGGGAGISISDSSARKIR